MILHWILAYRSSITCYVSVITLYLQHSLFYSLFFCLHLLYHIPSLSFTLRQSVHFGLLAQAPSIIQYDQSIFRFGTRVGAPSLTSLSPIHTTPYPLLLFSSNHSASNQNDYISLFPAYFYSFGMILHWILAYRFQSFHAFSIITLYLQHFAILFSNHLFTSTPSHTITIFHSRTVLKIWAFSPSTIYNTRWTISIYFLNMSWRLITDIMLQHFTILFPLLLFTHTLSISFTSIHFPTVLAFWAISPSATYNTIWLTHISLLNMA